VVYRAGVVTEETVEKSTAAVTSEAILVTLVILNFEGA